MKTPLVEPTTLKKTSQSKLANAFGYDTYESFISNFPSYDSYFIDTTKFPVFLKWLTFLLWNVFFIVMFIVFIHNGYVINRTHSFLSNDPTVGECTAVGITSTITTIIITTILYINIYHYRYHYQYYQYYHHHYYHYHHHHYY